MRWRAEYGQASTDFIALAALVGLVLVAAAGIATAAAPGLRNDLTSAWQRALCTVAGQRCDSLRREPCPVHRTTEARRRSVSIGLLKLGDDRELLIARRSDGSYAVTLAEAGRNGASVSVGGGVRGVAQLGASASAVIGGRSARTYVAADREAAVSLVERLRHTKLPDDPLLAARSFAELRAADPGVQDYVVGHAGATEAGADARVLRLAGAEAAAGRGRESGIRIDPHREEITRYFEIDSRASVLVEALSGVAGRVPQRGRRPTRKDELSSASGTAVWSAGLEAVQSATLALRHGGDGELRGATITVRGGDGRRLDELHVRIDVDDPVQRAAVRVLAADPGDIDGLRAAGEAARDGSASVDERSYTLASRERGAGAELALGLAVGGEQVHSVTTARLDDQWSRPLGGVWAPRLDCAT